MKKEKDEVFAKEITGLIDKADNYLESLIEEARLCASEIKRSLERYTETKKAIFHINSEILDLEKFLLTVNKFLNFEIPATSSVRHVFSKPETRIILALKKIDILRNYLYSIPGARLPEMPDSLRKLVIEEVLVIR